MRNNVLKTIVSIHPGEKIGILEGLLNAHLVILHLAGGGFMFSSTDLTNWNFRTHLVKDTLFFENILDTLASVYILAKIWTAGIAAGVEYNTSQFCSLSES